MNERPEFGGREAGVNIRKWVLFTAPEQQSSRAAEQEPAQSRSFEVSITLPHCSHSVSSPSSPCELACSSVVMVRRVDGAGQLPARRR